MNVAVVRRLATPAIGIAAAYLMSRQCRRPAGWFGRRLARTMNLSHASLTEWGLQHVRIEPDWRVLDVGCGGGQTIRSIAAMAPAGRVEGVDYSEASVAVAREKNRDLLASGRVAVQQASVSQLPFPDGSFDLVTAVETHYYWPDLPRDLREIVRVLKPGGRIAIIAETYKGRRMDWLYRPVMRLLLRATYLSLEEHRAALVEAGFTDVAIDAERQRGWVCAVGARPANERSSQ
jgi:ubiquinone/menaquinone biosynthesis C-methylase UbiE